VYRTVWPANWELDCLLRNMEKIVRQGIGMLHAVARNLVEIATFALIASPALADERATTVPLVIIGSPLPTAVIGDARHCPTGLVPSATVHADQVQFRLRTGEPASITLSDRRGARLCGGSLHIVPEAGTYYAARLTPGPSCEAQLFRIDPNANPPTTLLGSDNRPELDELICATQRGAPESSRFSAANLSGANLSGEAVAIEVGTDGICGKLSKVDREKASGVELVSGVKTWVHVMFRNYNFGGMNVLNACDVKFAFTPTRGASYFIEYSAGASECSTHLLQTDETSAVAKTPVEKVAAQQCP
jgi:hypothetical protein